MKNIKSFILGFVSATILIILMGAGKPHTLVFGDYPIYVNGKKAEINQQIPNIDGYVYLPLRLMSNVLGYKVEYDPNTRSIYLSNDGKTYVQKPVTNLNNNSQSNKEGRVIQGLATKYLKTKKVCDKYPEVGTINDCLEWHEEYDGFDLNKLKQALERGEVGINDTDENGNTLLMMAVKNNEYFVVDYLLKQPGINLNAQNNEGRTALHIGAINRAATSVGYIVKAGASTKIKDNYGKLPIDYVEEFGSTSDIWITLYSYGHQ